MPPRTPACHSAVRHAILRHVSPVWITDDVLADAFHRFLSVSNASRKRYGSNVPGPLEARRRASKRRMMGLATVGPGIGPDLGALFGPDKSLHQPWAWEPPKRSEQLLSREKPTAPVSPQWLPNYKDSAEKNQSRILDPVQEYRIHLAGVRNENDLDILWSEFSVESHHKVLFSQMANAHFLDNLDTEEMGYRALFGFMRNPKLNVPEARNTNTFIDLALKEGMPTGCLGELINHIRDSLRLGAMLPSELHNVVNSMPQLCATVCQNSDVAKDWQFHAYWAIWQGMVSCKILSVDRFGISAIRKMVKRLLVLGTPPEIQDITNLQKLRSTGHADAALFRLEIYRYLWPTRIEAKPDDFAAHFASWTRMLAQLDPCGATRTSDGLGWHVIRSVMDSMASSKARDVMGETTAALMPKKTEVALDEETQNTLQLWFSCISQTSHLEHPSNDEFDIFSQHSVAARRIDPLLAVPYLQRFPTDVVRQFWMHYWVPGYVDKKSTAKKRHAWMKRVKKAFEKQMKQPDSIADERVRHFFNAIVALKKEQVPWGKASPKAVEFVSAMYGPEVAHDLFKTLFIAKFNVEDPCAIGAVIESMCEDRPRQALKYFQATKNVWLSLCPRLPLALIKHGICPRDDLFALLDDYNPADTVPREQLPAIAEGLSALRVDLVHIIAHAYANQTAYPTRHRFRNVYYCWLWLRDRRAPMGPLLSKALVRAAITGPLENMEWVSTMKLRWVLRAVREIEGDEVADTLDRLVYHWRGEVILEARARWDAAGLYKTRGLSTVTLARAAGLFDHDYPRWSRWYRKTVLYTEFHTPKWMRKPRFGGTGIKPRFGRRGLGLPLWGRLPTRNGGKGGGKMWRWHHLRVQD